MRFGGEKKNPTHRTSPGTRSDRPCPARRRLDRLRARGHDDVDASVRISEPDVNVLPHDVARLPQVGGEQQDTRRLTRAALGAALTL
jgi:hypothetical protein